MHLFLTGEIQVGKTTIIRRVLQQHPRINIGGFWTVSKNDSQIQRPAVYIIPANNDPSSTTLAPTNRIGIKNTGAGALAYPQVFDQTGCRLLSAPAADDLIIMDEIGFMESRAKGFSERIVELLDGDIPIIGVIKQLDTPLLNRIRNHPQTELYQVTKDNREQIFCRIESRVSKLEAKLWQDSYGAAVIKEDSGQRQILLIQCPDREWSFPKGRRFPYETKVKAALREIFEETQVTAAINREDLDFYHYVPSRRLLPGEEPRRICFFLAHYLSGIPQPQLNEVQDARFFPLDQAQALIGYPPDREIIGMIDQYK